MSEQSTKQSVGVCETLKFDNDYEINSAEPHQIRKKSNGRIIKETLLKKLGYVQCALNAKQYYKHRILAVQYLDLDLSDKTQEIDHIDNDRSNNSLSNLRVVTRRQNNLNKIGSNGIVYEYVHDISADAIVVKEYNNYKFDDLYFHDNIFYFFNGIRYRKLHINEAKSGALYITAYDVDGKRRTISYAKFKHEYDLI